MTGGRAEGVGESGGGVAEDQRKMSVALDSIISIYHDHGVLATVPLRLLNEGQMGCQFSGAEGSIEGTSQDQI
jgi:hypothetical protein